MAKQLTVDMTKGRPLKQIVGFTIPMLIGNIFQVLYNMVDSIIVGRTISVDALAAVGAAGSIMFLIVGFAQGFTNGLAIVVAQRFGAGDEDGLRRSVGTGIILSFLATIVITAASIYSARPLLELMNTPANIIDDAYDYIIVIYWGIVFQLFYNYISSVIRALGDSRSPLYFLLVSCLVNIVLDLVFILNFNMGVAGAGLATIIAQALSGILCVIYIAKKLPILRLKKRDFKLTASFTWRHIVLAVPMAFQTSVIAIGTMVVQTVLNSFGSIAVAGYTAANKIEQLVSQPQISFGLAMATYVGQNYGAQNVARIKEGVRKCALTITGVTAVVVVLVLVFAGPLTTVFMDTTEDPALAAQVINYSKTYFYVAAVFYFLLGLLFVYRNSIQGMGGATIVLLGSFAELAARIVLSLVMADLFAGLFGSEFYGYVGVCAASPIAWLSAAALFIVSYYVKIRKLPAVFERQNREYEERTAREMQEIM